MTISSNTNMTSFNSDFAVDPFDRNIVVANVVTHIHAPQPRRLCLDTIYTGSCSPAHNQAIGSSISRPPAPIFNHPQPHRALRHDNTSHSTSSYIDISIERHSARACRWDNNGTPCGHELSQNIVAHFHQYHRIDVDSDESFTCSWITPHAGRCGKKLKVESFRRHIITHIGIKFRCSVCKKSIAARKDVATNHRRRHPVCSQAAFDTIQTTIPLSDK